MPVDKTRGGGPRRTRGPVISMQLAALAALHGIGTATCELRARRRLDAANRSTRASRWKPIRRPLALVSAAPRWGCRTVRTTRQPVFRLTARFDPPLALLSPVEEGTASDTASRLPWGGGLRPGARPGLEPRFATEAQSEHRRRALLGSDGDLRRRRFPAPLPLRRRPPAHQTSRRQISNISLRKQPISA